MSMPEQDDFFRQLGKKLDKELPFEQLPEDWASISAQIPGKPVRKKYFWWWWLLFLMLLGTNLTWYIGNQKLRDELRDTTEALVAAQHHIEKNQPAAASASGNESMAERREYSPEDHVQKQKSSQPVASNMRSKQRPPAPLPTAAQTVISENPSAQTADTVAFMQKYASSKVLFPIPPKHDFLKNNTNLYIVRLPNSPPAIATIEKANNRRYKWQISPSMGYTFLKTDSLPITRGTEMGLRLSRRMAGGFSMVAGASQRAWKFGLDNPEPGLMDSVDTSCPYCPLDTILIVRKQWSVTVSLTYEKEISNHLAVQLGLGWTYVPRFNQEVTYRYLPVYGGTHLTVTERSIPVAGYSLANMRVGLVFPARARFAGLLAAQYDVPLKAGTIGWWGIQAGWRLAF